MAPTLPNRNPIRRVIEVLRFEKQEISAIYFYAVLAGLVQLSLPLGVQAIISFVLGGSISTSLVLLIAGVIAGVFLNGLLQVNGMKLIERIQQQLFVRYSFLYAHTVPRLDLKSVDGYYLPELVNRFFDTVALQKGLSKLLLDVPLASIQILFGLTLLSFYHPVFIFFGLVLLLVLWGILRLTANRGIETSLQESEYKYRVAGFLQTLARKVVAYKYARNPALQLGRTDRMLIVGALLLVNQQLNVGQFIAAEIVILTVINSVEKLIINLDNVYDVLTAVEKLGKVIDKPQEGNGAQASPISSGFPVRAVDVAFKFPSSTKPVLQDLTFSILPGEKVCIAGATGSGKSTLMRLLAGIYSPTEGSLLLSDVPLQHYDTTQLRSRIGLMLEGQGLVAGTLLENLGMGESLTPSDLSQLEPLTDAIGLKAFIHSHPSGYNMELEPEGTHLSARTTRQIALFRALLHKPALLLLEEPWADLAGATAKNIQDYLLRGTDGATVVVATNDIDFTMQCDKVIILEKGRLKAVGTPAEAAHLLQLRHHEGN
jgi:ABC-type bacteriocin/lantibiotic exporter with double-glycine peptidase domain